MKTLFSGLMIFVVAMNISLAGQDSVTQSGVTTKTVSEIIQMITDVNHFRLDNVEDQVRIDGTANNFTYWTHVAQSIVITTINMKFFNRMTVRRNLNVTTIQSIMITDENEIQSLRASNPRLTNSPSPLVENNLTIRITDLGATRNISITIASKTSMGTDRKVRSGLRNSIDEYLLKLEAQ